MPEQKNIGPTSLPQLHPQHAVEFVAERRRQVETEGYSSEDDDRLIDDELVRAAACYALSSDDLEYPNGEAVWPRSWDFKPKDRRRRLIRSGALLLAELERMDRAGG